MLGWMRTSPEDDVLVQLNGRVHGPYPVKSLRNMIGFNGHCLVSYPGSDKWAPAFRVLANIQSYEPPMAYTPATREPIPDWTAPAQSPAFDWKADRIPGAKVNRWLKRMAVFNLLLAIGAYSGWSFSPLRIPIQNELRRQMTEQELRWGPQPFRIVRYHAIPTQKHAFRKSPSRTI